MKIRLSVNIQFKLTDDELPGGLDDRAWAKTLEELTLKRVERWFPGRRAEILATATVDRDEKGKI